LHALLLKRLPQLKGLQLSALHGKLKQVRVCWQWLLWNLLEAARAAAEAAAATEGAASVSTARQAETGTPGCCNSNPSSLHASKPTDATDLVFAIPFTDILA
jgi:hypothetical protein